MTGQMHDKVSFEDEIYHLVSVECEEELAESLPTPIDFGFSHDELTAPHTACWRGYLRIFKVKSDNQLYLDQLQINTNDETLRTINGVKPNRDSKEFKFKYEDLDLLVEFSGKLEMAQDMLHEYYIHMGFQAPKTFGKVLKLTIKAGKVTKVEDMSNYYQKMRQQTKKAKK